MHHFAQFIVDLECAAYDNTIQITRLIPLYSILFALSLNVYVVPDALAGIDRQCSSSTLSKSTRATLAQFC